MAMVAGFGFNSDNLNLDLISIFLWATIYFKFGMNVNFN